jgi:hypothetical protein
LSSNPSGLLPQATELNPNRTKLTWLVEKFVAVGKIQQPGADSVKADLGASAEKVRTNARC